jgi:DNA-binding NtrC family response regulator
MSPSTPDLPDEARVEPGTTLVRTRRGEASLVARAAALTVEAGPDRGARVELALQRTRIGTAASNQLVLSDPRVSRQHLELRVCDQGYLVRDLDSTNGTFYRGARIVEAMIEAGAELRLGDTVLRLEQSGELPLPVAARPAFGSLVGSAPAMQQVYGLLAAVAPTDATVLILGETGTGKELVAEELHRHSPRRDHAFVVVDCGAIPAGLIESELFGHVRGAFTGALSEQAGAFERAHGGTVFLDEIGEFPLELQSRLLRALDRRAVKRVGGSDYRQVDLRVVAATNRDLRKLVEEGQFRQDLYYRLGVLQIRVPPLRERPEDIPLLARHFLWQSGCADPDSVLTREVLAILATRRWRGNVRELRNVIERAAVLSDDVRLAVEADPSLPSPSPGSAGAEAAEAQDHRRAWVVSPALLGQPYRLAKEELLRQFELLYLQRLVEEHGENISRIAAAAGIDRQLVRRLLRRHGLRND